MYIIIVIIHYIQHLCLVKYIICIKLTQLVYIYQKFIGYKKLYNIRKIDELTGKLNSCNTGCLVSTRTLTFLCIIYLFQMFTYFLGVQLCKFELKLSCEYSFFSSTIHVTLQTDIF